MFDFYVSARTSQKEIALSLETVLTDQIEVYLNDDKLSETGLGNFDLVLMQGNNRVELLLTNGYHTVNYNITIYYEPPAITTRRPIITTTPSTTTIVEPSTRIPNTNNEMHAEEPIPPASNHAEPITPVIDIPLTSDTQQNIEPTNITKHPDILNQTNIGLLQVEGAAIYHDVFQSDDNVYFLKYNRK